jgi:AbiV family abortive infection protein
MRKTLSPYKHKRLAIESFRNSLRLLKDALALYHLRSYPTAFQLAVLSMEEYSKARWVEYVWYSYRVSGGFPEEDPNGDEQEWLRLLYSHTDKHKAFLRHAWEHYSPKLHEAANGELDLRKQKATYVGLPKKGRLVNVNGRVSLPNATTQADAKQMISLVAGEVKGAYKTIAEDEWCFDMPELDEIVTSHEAMFVFGWRHRTGLKSKRFVAPNLEILEKKVDPLTEKSKRDSRPGAK